MIARIPEKKSVPRSVAFSTRLSRVANDNRPPRKHLLGWIFVVMGLLLFTGAFFWAYEKVL